MEKYSLIINKRFGNRIEININYSSDVLKIEVQKMILQPIVENAIIHGLEDKIQNSFLIINY